jgi:glycerophosphoryl diester phosphodiesterase
MENIIKLAIISLLSLQLSAKEVPFNTSTLSYRVDDKVHTYQEKIPLLKILKKDKKSEAITVIKSSENHYDKDKMEIEFIVMVTLHRDINNLTISDNIIQGFQYKNASIRLNNTLPTNFKVLDRAVTIYVGDVKKGESYKMRYLVEPEVK